LIAGRSGPPLGVGSELLAAKLAQRGPAVRNRERTAGPLRLFSSAGRPRIGQSCPGFSTCGPAMSGPTSSGGG